MSPGLHTDRRNFLKTAAALTVTGSLLAGCTSSGTSGDSDNTPNADSGRQASFDGWFENTANYEEVIDKTDTSTVAVQVGADGNNGAYAFAPPAIKIASGTTVTWEWTGMGGSHNVVADDGSFESEMTAEQGHTFDHSFDSAGTYKYYCLPHKAMGMKGVVVVE